MIEIAAGIIIGFSLGTLYAGLVWAKKKDPAFQIGSFKFNPGDQVVLCTEEPISVQQAQRIKDAWEAHAPGFGKVMVLGDGIKLQVLNHEQGVNA